MVASPRLGRRLLFGVILVLLLGVAAVYAFSRQSDSAVDEPGGTRIGNGSPAGRNSADSSMVGPTSAAATHWGLVPAAAAEQPSTGAFQRPPADWWLDFAQLQKRLETRGVDRLIAELATAQISAESNADSEQLLRALDLSRHVLRSEPEQLWFQLFSRTRRAPRQPIQRLLGAPPAGEPLIPRFVAAAQAGGPLVRVMYEANQGVLGVDMSPDGKQIATACGDGRLVVWEFASGRSLWEVQAHPSMVHGVRFSPDGKTICTAGGEGTVRLWEATHGAPQQQLEIPSNGAYTIAFTPTGRTIAIGCDGSANANPPHDLVTLWEPHNGRRRTLPGYKRNVKSVDFSPDGQRLITADQDGQLRVWNVAEAKEVWSVEAFESAASCARFSPSGETIAASAFASPEIKLWAVGDERPLHVLHSQDPGVTQLEYSSDGSHLVSAGQQSRVELWRIAEPDKPLAIGNHSGLVNDVTFAPQSVQIVSASSDQSVRIWDFADSKLSHPRAWHGGRVNAVALSSGGELLASGGADGILRIWNARTGEGRQQISIGRERIDELCFSPSGDRIAALTGDHIVRIWELNGGSLIHQAEVPKSDHHASFPGMSAARSIAFSPDGQRYAAGGHRSIRVWDAESKQPLMDLHGHENIVHALAFSPDGRSLVSGSGDKTIRFWDLSDGSEVRKIETRQFVEHLEFFPDGRSIIACSNGPIVERFTAPSGELLKQYKAHRDWVKDAVLVDEGRTLVTVGYDGAVKVWNPDTAEILHSRTLDLRIAAVATDGRQTLAIAGPDGQIHVYDLR